MREQTGYWGEFLRQDLEQGYPVLEIVPFRWVERSDGRVQRYWKAATTVRTLTSYRLGTNPDNPLGGYLVYAKNKDGHAGILLECDTAENARFYVDALRKNHKQITGKDVDQ